MNCPIQPHEVLKKSLNRPPGATARGINGAMNGGSPHSTILPGVESVNRGSPHEGKKGLCLYCSEIFNLKDYHRDDLVCPECAEVFDLPTPKELRRARKREAS